MCGCVLVWDSEFPQYSKGVVEYEKSRKALHSTNSIPEQEFDEQEIEIYNRTSN
jgi:hypothetical protein